MRLYTPAIVAVVIGSLGMSASSRAADEPLAYVPGDASLFAHVRFGDLWNSTIGQEVRKAAGKDLEKPLAEFQKEVGIPLENIDTATFFFPNLPVGPGDQQVFAVIATTVKPYDRNALLPKVRKKDAKATGNIVELQDKFVLQFLSDTMFLVMHQSLTEKIGKGPQRDDKQGVMSEALKLAGEKHQFVFSIDFSKLPNELFTAAPAELQPFLPLLKTKSSTLFADLKDRDLKVGLNFTSTDANAAEDAERSFKLLMKLAGDGMADALKEASAKKDIVPIVPLLKELDRGLKTIKMAREGVRLENSMALKIDQPIGDLVGIYAKRAREDSTRAVAQNNLKQLALAMQNYHNEFKGLPPAAICDNKGKPLLSWRVAILPYVDGKELYEQFKLDEAWDSENNKKLVAKMPRVFGLPDAKSEGKTHYRVFHGNGAAFDLIQPVRFQDITDGTSNTVMIVETAESVPWTKPDDLEFDDKLQIEKLLRFVDDRTNVVFCDNFVRSLKKGLGDKTWRLLIQRNDGEPLPDLEK